MGLGVAGRCQACRVGVPLIRTQVGKADEPMGVCANCSSLTCGHHGYRAPKPEFLCIQCDVALQAGSAGWNKWLASGSHVAAGPPGGATDEDDVVGAALRALVPGGWSAAVTSFEVWASQHPVYAVLIELVRQDLDNMLQRLNGVQPGATWPPSVREGVTADPEMASQFALFWAGIDERGRRLLAAALVMALVMNLALWSLPPILSRIANVAGISFRDEFPDPGHEIPYEDFRYQ